MQMNENESVIIPPVDREVLKGELTREKYFRKTNNAQNEIYIIDAHNSPQAMREVARLREESFRQSGGGTGQSLDMDDFDTAEVPYKQLIVWDPDAEEIVGGYRFMRCWEAAQKPDGTPRIATAELFRFSPVFIKDYLPYTIELGRSFVQPAYQPSRDNRKSIYSLDNLWDGLGGLVVDYPQLRYFVGKVTMYKHFDPFARDLILYFMQRYFPDPDELIRPFDPLPIHTPREKLEKVFSASTFQENYRLLSTRVRKRKENIPPLFNSYMGLSPTMRTFGTAHNKGFGGVEETGIMVTIKDIYDVKTRRHVDSYREEQSR
jgi:hypothetical protein